MTPSRSDPGCPICGRPPTPVAAPFCSRGCRDRDLLQWLGDGYRLPGPAADADADGVDADRVDADRVDRRRTPD